MPSYKLNFILGHCFPNVFARGPLLALKNNHRSSHPYSRKYNVWMIGFQN